MKRIITVLAVLTLVAGGACSKPNTVGEGLEGKGSSKIASPTPTLSSKKPSAKPTKKKVATVKPNPGYPGRPHSIVINDSANGYDPAQRRVFVGDTITFTNNDTTSKHSWTADNGAWDSGALDAGKSFVFKVNLAPGRYTWHCEVVPYVLGGPLEVLAAPK